ncbi:MAG: LacI family DNA-binding transcriptional regulator, partial [Maribacter sp.]
MKYINVTNYSSLNSNRKVTIHDIAKELNITAATVSRALNDTGRISENTRKRIKETAARVNYRPNSLASSLRSGKSGSIGVIVPTINRAFFSSVVRGLEEIAKKKGYKVIIAQSNDDFETEVDIIDTMVNAQVEGIFVSMSKA